jgi:hypothetical protein
MVTVDELKPKLTDEFLQTLVEAVHIVGWTVDAVETVAFLEEVFALAGKKAPTVELPGDD